MSHGSFIEKPLQSDMPKTQADRPLAASRPLFELAGKAPSWSSEGRPSWPFSTDLTAPYFNILRMRTLTDSYRKASNRVALVIGESSLAAALPFIPEETIIAFDCSPAMCTLMSRYISALRTTNTPGEWYEKMEDSVSFAYHYNNDIQTIQKPHWRKHGLSHPLARREEVQMQSKRWKSEEDKQKDEEEQRKEYEASKKAYTNSQALAREKAIIPWCGNLFDAADVRHLADTLREESATITFMNLSNVVAPSTSEAEAEQLQLLPVTPDVPILSTSLATAGYGTTYEYWSTRPRLPEAPGLLVNGPYFGISALLNGMSATDKAHRSIVTRQYFPQTQS